jgi:1,4-dihydroxy-2-naphthoate octaprenyltransferase
MEKQTAGSPRDLWVRLLLYPGHTLPTAFAPVAVGVGLAIHDEVFALMPVLLAFLGSWLIHVAGVLTDNHELLRLHPGVEEHPELLQALRSGALRLGFLRLAILLAFGSGATLGALLVFRGGWPVVVLGVIGVVSAWGYAGRPLAYAARGWADPVFFGMFGALAPLGTYAIQAAWVAGPSSPGMAAVLNPEAWIAGLSVGAAVTSVLVIDDIRDRHFDARKGWRTPAVRFGLVWSRREFVALTAFAYLWPCVLWLGLGYGPVVLLPLVTLPENVAIVRAVLRHDSTPDLFAYTPRTARLSMIHGILLGIGLAVS